MPKNIRRWAPETDDLHERADDVYLSASKALESLYAAEGRAKAIAETREANVRERFPDGLGGRGTPPHAGRQDADQGGALTDGD